MDHGSRCGSTSSLDHGSAPDIFPVLAALALGLMVAATSVPAPVRASDAPASSAAPAASGRPATVHPASDGVGPVDPGREGDLEGGIHDKPYNREQGRDIAVGGYIDMEFEWNEDGSTFDQHRFIPFITGHVSERVTVSAEIEFEHGGYVSGSDRTDGEVKLEFAVLDFRLSESFNYRGGVILSPLGAFNLLHDSPLNDLTERPLVDRQLIPTTLSEAGMGFFGTVYPGIESVLTYEAYLVNGFDEEIISGGDGNERLRIRGGRGSQKQDNNDDKAFVGRLGLSPRLGVSVGGSVHTGKWDDADEHRLTIAALDARWNLGALELLGEYAIASADLPDALADHVADSQRGAYVQVNHHVLHDAVLDGSVFTLVARGDWLDFDSDVDGDHQRGVTVGVNFRPTEETVFKLDHGWSWNTARGATSAQDPDRQIFFSFASYF
ncbi:MAG: hypothetical protein R6X25_15730 [Candidatus Krumholzibacteriia bacterium]